METYINDLMVYKSGSLVIVETNKLKFKFTDNLPSIFHEVQIEFVDDVSDNKFAEVNTKDILKLKLPLRIKFLPKNVNVGLIGDKELFLNYHLVKLEENSYIFTYLFLIKY